MTAHGRGLHDAAQELDRYLAREPDFESWDARYFASVLERFRAHCDGKVDGPFRLLPEELPMIMLRCYGAWQLGVSVPSGRDRLPTLRGMLFGVETEIVFDGLVPVSRFSP